MTPAIKTLPPAAPGAKAVPRLENGDLLSREEFERRYKAAPRWQKAELIDGVVHMPSPVRHRRHGKPQSRLSGWVVHYETATPGIESSGNGTLRLDDSSEPQPDAFLLISPEFGGQAVIDEDDYVAGAPEWVGEIAASSVSYDLHVKLRAYQRNGVKEYVVWRVEDGAVDWFVRRGDKFQPLPSSEIYKSEVFPGLWLDASAMIAGDLKKVFQVLDQGLATPEHSAFVQQLQQRRDQLAKKSEKEQ
ncbi:MAG TPA: Uma2 family endonuclease [Gemmataceae bacterium]|nr:Uma2 family endonuclease [Gemmataceae bacterium]